MEPQRGFIGFRDSQISGHLSVIDYITAPRVPRWDPDFENSPNPKP